MAMAEQNAETNTPPPLNPPKLLVEHSWDPFQHIGDTATPQSLSRIKRDIRTLYDEPPPGIFVVSDESDYTVIHALVTGTFDTPYEGGFFYFLLRCPGNYPLRPPWVKLMTTGGGTVRFNPNLYRNGKVCLSILGTWSGPGWSPANTLSSCLLSIQSILCEKPYHNEPGFEREKVSGDVLRYNEIIQHETLRVAVCGMIENDTSISMPEPLVQAMEQTFLQFYDTYEATVRSKLHLTNFPMYDPFGERRGVFQYQQIHKRLQECKNRILAKLKEEPTDETSDVSDISDTSDDKDGQN